METELNLNPESIPDPNPDLESDQELITDPDPNLQKISDPAGSGCTTLSVIKKITNKESSRAIMDNTDLRVIKDKHLRNDIKDISAISRYHSPFCF